MPRLTYDLEKISDTLEHGKFRARLKSCTDAISERSGKPTLIWVWELREGPNKGATVKSWTSKQESALFGIKQHLMAFGYTKKVDINTDRLIGKEVYLVIGERKGKNAQGEEQMYTSVNALLPLKSLRDADVDEEDVDDEWDEEEEEEEEDKPASRRKASKGRAAVATKRRRSEPEDEDDDEEEDEEDDDWEDDEEEEEHPRARGRVSGRTNGTTRRR